MLLLAFNFSQQDLHYDYFPGNTGKSFRLTSFKNTYRRVLPIFRKIKNSIKMAVSKHQQFVLNIIQKYGNQMSKYSP